MKELIISELKGGSLSKTILIKKNNKKFIRKLIDIEENREFGFYRWLSQLKKIQRLNNVFPRLFPKVLRSGLINKSYFFDIEYFSRSKNCYEYLINEKNNKKINLIFEKIIKNLNMLNNMKYPSVKGSHKIYFNEEIKRRIIHFKNNKKGKNFINYKEYEINGKKIKNSINKIISWLDTNTLDFKTSRECYTHGNLTLENILFIPSKNRIVFIDPYEENFVDSSYQEISQLLQSCNSHYELLCHTNITINKNILNFNYLVPTGLKTFNKNLKKYIDINFSTKEKKIIKFYEMAQFIRMLPFKLENDPDRAKLFFVIAIKIFNNEIYE